jgi:hypothetical protein
MSGDAISSRRIVIRNMGDGAGAKGDCKLRVWGASLVAVRNQNEVAARAECDK